jgi:hypothetical protein
VSDTTDPVAEDQRIAEMEAELELRKLERKLATAKPKPSRKLKDDVREARLHHRAVRQGLVVVEDKRGRHVALEPDDAKGMKRVGSSE